jgi:hypothetical protein
MKLYVPQIYAIKTINTRHVSSENIYFIPVKRTNLLF